MPDFRFTVGVIQREFWANQLRRKLIGSLAYALAAPCSILVCTESSTPDVVVMQSAKEGV